MSILLSLLALQAGLATEEGPRRASPIQPLNSWVSDNDYPADALARGAEGTVAFRLVVSPEGRVVDCKIDRSSGHASLDAQTCAVMTTRARFHPARNASGRPVIDTVRSGIRWVRGQAMPPGMAPFASMRMAIIVSLTSDRQIRCTIEVNGTPVPRETPVSRETPCPRLPPAILQTVETLNAGSQLAIVRSFIPDGGTIAAPEISYGRLLSETAAEFTIDEGGQMTDCRTVSRAVHVPDNPMPPDLCAAPLWPRYPSGAANRRARLTLSLYLGTRTAS